MLTYQYLARKFIFNPVNLYYNKRNRHISTLATRLSERERTTAWSWTHQSKRIEIAQFSIDDSRRVFPSEATKSWWLVRTRGSPHVSRGHLLTPLKIPDEASR